MSLQKDIENNLNIALKAKDTVKTGTLRMLKSSLQNKSIELKKDSLDDEEIINIIRKEVKKRQDSITSFKQGDRQDLVEKEEVELKILEEYLPAMMSEENISKIVDEIIASGESNFGLVMKQVMAKTKGQADGKIVQKLVKEKL